MPAARIIEADVPPPDGPNTPLQSLSMSLKSFDDGHLRPRVGTAFVGPGDRFSVLSVAATEMGTGAENVERERSFRERHQAAVADLLRAISADRLGVERLPGRPDK